MKKNLPLFVLSLLLCIVGFSQNDYYWYNSKKVPLNQDRSVLYVKVKTDKAPAFTKPRLTSLFKVSDTSLYQLSDTDFVIKSNSSIDTTILKSQSWDFKYSAPLFRNSAGSTFIIVPRIVLRLNEGHSIDEVLSLYKGVLSLSKSKGFNTYVLECIVKTSGELLKITNDLYEKSGIVTWSEPEFYSNFKPATDPLYPNQYYLKNTGQFGGVTGIDINVEPAWAMTLGCTTLRVAVIDEGVEDHEDLLGRVVGGYTAGTIGTGAPQNGVKGHGEACAGIIAASHNDIGIRGIAPNVRIVPVNIFPLTPDPNFNPGGSATSQEIAAAIDWAWNQGAADVLSCSWGGGAQSNDIDAAIGRARTQGRGNKGCPVIFSSGNNDPFTNVTYPGNVNGVITVGACNNAAPSGAIWYYSDRGASMDLVAPSGDVNLLGDVATTDRMGTAGYEIGNYTNRFGGTSAACPQVSGTAALMLSVSPNLTEQQVTSILQTTATDMGTAGFDNTFGFGRVNAGAAVYKAYTSVMAISGPKTFCTSGTYSVTNLPSGATVSWILTSGYVSSVTNGNSITLTKVADGVVYLNANLTLPCGTVALVQFPIVVGKVTSNGHVQFDTGVPANPISVCKGGSERGTMKYYDDYGNNSGSIPTPYSFDVTNGTKYSFTRLGATNNYEYEISPTASGTLHVPVKINNGCGMSTAIYNLDMQVHTCLMSSSNYNIYPNPAANELRVTYKPAAAKKQMQVSEDTPAGTFTIMLSDLSGRVLKTAKSRNGEGNVIIDIHNIPNGTYFITIISNNNERVQEKVVILH
ncbi:MAG: S8 family peptidase [Chitinophagaceae bacterium]|nr:S8 family peptidase [Chitinophagaceae bacterium]